MTALLHILLALLSVATPAKPVLHAMSVPRAPLAVGIALHYHPYPDPWGRSMRQVAGVRGMVLLPDVLGYVSTRACWRVDTESDPTLKTKPWRVYAQIGPATGWWQLVDCSAPADVPHQAAMGVIVETDNFSARLGGWDYKFRLGKGAGHAPATIWRYER